MRARRAACQRGERGHCRSRDPEVPPLGPFGAEQTVGPMLGAQPQVTGQDKPADSLQLARSVPHTLRPVTQRTRDRGTRCGGYLRGTVSGSW